MNLKRRVRRLLPITVWERRREPHAGKQLTHAQANVRVGEQIYPQLSPDPVRRGLTPARPARQQVAIMAQPFGLPPVFGHGMGMENFAVMTYGPAPKARTLPGIQEPVGIRPNIDVPASVAYGSLFSLQTAPYGFS